MNTRYPPFIFGVPLCFAPFLRVWLHRQPSLSPHLCTLILGLFGAVVMVALVGTFALVRRNRPLQLSWRSSILQIIGMALLATLADYTSHQLFPR